MKKLKYIKPEIVTVSFRVEIGQGGSGFGINNHTNVYDRSARFMHDEGFGTGETYGAYTDARGEYSTGSW